MIFQCGNIISLDMFITKICQCVYFIKFHFCGNSICRNVEIVLMIKFRTEIQRIAFRFIVKQIIPISLSVYFVVNSLHGGHAMFTSLTSRSVLLTECVSFNFVYCPWNFISYYIALSGSRTDRRNQTNVHDISQLLSV